MMLSQRKEVEKMKISLRLLRAERNMSVEEVARQSGITGNTIRSLEKNENQGLNETRNALYKFYGYELVPRKLDSDE